MRKLNFWDILKYFLSFAHCIYILNILFYRILYIHCMLVREIWKCIHPRVSYSLRATPEGKMRLVGEYIFIFPEPACYECFIIPNETKKTYTCKILLANIFGALSQTFKNHIHNKWCVPSASDVFLSKNVNSRSFREGGIWFLSCVITCSDFYLLSNQINLTMVINIWGIIKWYV